MFTGFTDETVDFMWGIRFNNERTWFEAHKETYLTHFYRPMTELGDEIYEFIRDKRPDYGLIRKVTRIYRDARRLMAVYYLITGSCYRPAVSCERICVGQWCTALRERYHAEVCGGFNYARAQDGTTDSCLGELLGQLSADEYRHAEVLMGMLERSLSGRSSC